MALYPKVLRAREHASIPYSFVVFTLDLYSSLSRSLGTYHLSTCEPTHSLLIPKYYLQ
jgi:hypothetical protein